MIRHEDSESEIRLRRDGLQEPVPAATPPPPPFPPLKLVRGPRKSATYQNGQMTREPTSHNGAGLERYVSTTSNKSYANSKEYLKNYATRS